MLGLAIFCFADLCGCLLCFCFFSPHSCRYYNKTRKEIKRRWVMAALYETCVHISLLGINNLFTVCWEIVFDYVGGLSWFVLCLFASFFIVEIRPSILLKIMNKQLVLHLQWLDWNKESAHYFLCKIMGCWVCASFNITNRLIFAYYLTQFEYLQSTIHIYSNL